MPQDQIILSISWKMKGKMYWGMKTGKSLKAQAVQGAFNNSNQHVDTGHNTMQVDISWLLASSISIGSLFFIVLSCVAISRYDIERPGLNILKGPHHLKIRSIQLLSAVISPHTFLLSGKSKQRVFSERLHHTREKNNREEYERNVIAWLPEIITSLYDPAWHELN